MFKRLLTASVVLLAAACGNNGGTIAEKQDILAANLDTSINPGDDFFAYANGGWIKKNPIPADQSSWGIGGLVVEENRKRLREIAENAVKANAPDGTDQQKIGTFWTVAMDSTKIEQDGIKPLQPYLDKINNIKDAKSLQTAFAEFDVIGVGGPIGVYVSQDDKNSTVYALQMGQTGIGLPEREYYFKTDSSTLKIRAAYVKHITKILALAGADTLRAANAAKNILALETQLAKAHRTRAA